MTFGAYEGLVTDRLKSNGYPAEHILNLGDEHHPTQEQIIQRMIIDQPTPHVLVVGFVNIHTHQAEEMLEYFEHEAQPWGRRRATTTTPTRWTWTSSSRTVPPENRSRPDHDRPRSDTSRSESGIEAGRCTTTCSRRRSSVSRSCSASPSRCSCTRRRHLTTGSIVVPGYIATFIAIAVHVLATFLNAFVSYWLINKVLRKWFLLYGRTKFTRAGS